MTVDSELLKPIAHGGGLTAAMVQFGGKPSDWLDLSTGINPNSYPVGQISDAGFQRLPDQKAHEQLIDAAKQFYGVARTNSDWSIIAGNGTQAFIQNLPQIFEGKRKVGIVGPTYGEYQRCWAMGGHSVEIFRSLESINDVSVAIVVNPNNPDGKLYQVAALEKLARRLNEHGGILIVDEAFGDMDHRQSVVNSECNNIIVLKSFGKFFGLAGLRLGFAIGNPTIVGRLKNSIGPWPVSGPALEIGTSALRDTKWIDVNRNWIAGANSRLCAILCRQKNEIVGNGGLFVLVKTDATKMIGDKLSKLHILVRQFEERPGLIRLGLCRGGEQEMRLDRALASVVGDKIS